jgi:PIN domain nuclease of toxin-antitoxin system
VNILLDTATFLWIADDSPRLSVGARDRFVDPNNTIFLSAASAWEIVIKYRLGKLPLPEGPEIFVPAEREAHGIESLAVDEESALQLARLPNLHNDPFDRILISQAVVHGLAILTPDEMIHQYGIRALW